MVKVIDQTVEAPDTSFPAKYQKVIKELPEFKDIADAAGVDELKKMIITAEGNLFVIEQEKTNDSKLTAAKELVKEYSEPYRDAAKVLVAKTKYCIYLLEGKGVQIDSRDEE